MIKRLGIIGLLIVVACGVCGVIGVLGGIKLFSGMLDSTREVGDSANAFMEALRNNKLDDAYAMFTPDLQEQESRSNFGESFTGNTLKDWSFNNFSIRDDLGYVAGRAADADGDHFVAFQLVYQNGGWAIDGYNLRALGRAGTIIEPID